MIALLLLSAGCGANADQAGEPTTPAASATPPTAEPTPGEAPADDPACEAPGRYTDYSAAAVADECYTDTILFFHAPWCPECRGFEEAIKSGEVPDGAQILKVDYDSATDLRKQHEVTIQSTFVRVDPAGERVKLWSGYGKDKSVDAILENTK
ncbi:thioredoxin domain-containing protein [Nocardioides sp. NPDC023903]|uniref:thioredoxin domain-containing protein n=1 Tax=Nocardioides sp. NPDC023903 TaxID=3157195 RepID=UPI0033EF40CE